jgi:hypothetical protein
LALQPPQHRLLPEPRPPPEHVRISIAHQRRGPSPAGRTRTCFIRPDTSGSHRLTLPDKPHLDIIDLTPFASLTGLVRRTRIWAGRGVSDESLTLTMTCDPPLPIQHQMHHQIPPFRAAQAPRTSIASNASPHSALYLNQNSTKTSLAKARHPIAPHQRRHMHTSLRTRYFWHTVRAPVDLQHPNRCLAPP